MSKLNILWHTSLSRLQPLAIVLLAMVITSCGNGRRHGFRLIEKRFVSEINAECLLFEHQKSGARLIKVMADDPNKTFAITFRTFPESDNGTPHIMEHSVLNGSKNFPVKSPFDILVKGSLNTFINAFTSKDYTMYPVASMNDKDYFNLMHVYLDAVFNPLLYTDPRILKQEGWHYELADKHDPVTYKGVVYNEMKGAFSNPQRELRYQMFRNLFPDNSYGFESGGHPSAIPTLTQEAFVNYHRRYYHPENSYIFLYGNADLDQELAFIDSAYLAKYDRTGNLPGIADQKPFSAMKEVTAPYPVMEGASTDKQTYLSLSWVAGHSTDLALSMSLDILCEALVNQESAPVRLALQKAGIGQDVSASAYNFKQNTVQIMVQNADPGEQQKFHDVVIKTLKEVSARGLDKKDLEGIINRTEFRLREGDDAQKGITALQQVVQPWFFSDDPFSGLRYEEPLAEVKTALKTDYLEQVIKRCFLENPHCLLLALEPKPGLEQERVARTEAELAKFKSSLNDTTIATLIIETKELVEYQKKQDSPETVATIPMLKASDINPVATYFAAQETKTGEVPTLFYPAFTNGVVYVRCYFDMRTLPADLLPYASLIANTTTALNTKNYTYGSLNQALNAGTGGFSTSLAVFQENLDDNKLLPEFFVASKAMPGKLPEMVNLTLEILLNSRFDDPERLRTVLSRHQAQLEEEMKSDGYGVASGRAPSYFSRLGVFNQLTGGIDYYRFVTELTKNFDRDRLMLEKKLNETARMLFTRNNVTFGITCDSGDLAGVRGSMEKLAGGLPDVRTDIKAWDLVPEKLNEGILAPSKVQYVVSGYNFKKLGFAWDGRMRVLSQILSTDWLQQSIRVIGGAYGGWSSFSADGTALFYSYRDPNLRGTLDNFRASADYLDTFRADEKEMTRYIIGTIAGMDQPLTPAEQGEKAFRFHFTKRGKAEVQAERDAVLSTRQEDIRGFARLVKAINDQKSWCVYGNADRIRQDKDLFSNLVTIEK